MLKQDISVHLKLKKRKTQKIAVIKLVIIIIIISYYFAFSQLSFVCYTVEVQTAPYYGKFLGKLSELHHGVSGEVYVVDGRTLYLKDFTYDGQGPGKLNFSLKFQKHSKVPNTHKVKI